MERVRVALFEILRHAENQQIQVGIEARKLYEDVPSEREMEDLLAEFQSPFLGYWHDFGHIQMKQNLSFVNHVEWLGKMRDRLIGSHLHDVQWPDLTHRVPMTGTTDYDTLIPMLPKDKPLVWEIDKKRKKADIRNALPLWIERYGN